MNIVNPETAKVSGVTKLNETVPVIDFAQTRETALIANEIGKACEDWGFFQIVNHGISTKSIETLWNDTQNFFSLPKNQKRSLNRTSENPWGYLTRN